MDSAELKGKTVVRISTRKTSVLLVLTDRTVAFLEMGGSYRVDADLTFAPVASAHLTLGCATITFEDGRSIYVESTEPVTPTVTIVH